MSENLERRYKDLKESIARFSSEAEQAKGAMSQLLNQLEEFGCKTLKEAESKLKVMETDCEKSRKALETEMKDYQRKWDAGI